MTDKLLGVMGSSSAAEWHEALASFVAVHANSFSFAFAYDAKRSFVAALHAQLLRSDPAWPIETLLLALQTLAVLARERDGFAGRPADLVPLCTTLTHFVHIENDTTPEPAAVSRIEMATKALINISTQQGAPADFSFCRELMKLELPTALLKATRSFSRPEQLPMLFPVLRLLFFFCSDDAARAEIGLEHLTGAVTDALERATELLESKQGDEMLCVNSLTEGVRAIFISFTHLGPLANSEPPNEFEQAINFRLAALYQKFLLLPVDHKYDALKSQTVSAMINLPACVNDSFDPLPTIASLIAILNTQAFKAGSPQTNLTSILLILTSIAKGIPASRPILKNAIFPNNETVEPAPDPLDPPPAFTEPGTLSSILLKLMCSPSVPLYTYSAQLFYTICDEDPTEFVRIVGGGNAAGFMANNDMMAVFSAALSKQKRSQAAPKRQLTVDEMQARREFIQRLQSKGLLPRDDESDDEDGPDDSSRSSSSGSRNNDDHQAQS